MASYPVSLNEDDLPRTYLADLEERRVGGDKVSEAKVSCQRRRVDRDGPRRVCPERGDLGRERHAAAFVMIEEGPLTGSISSEKEFAIRWIPEREREHSGKSLDKPFSEVEVETWNHRDLRCRGHHPAPIRQPCAQGPMVVKLTGTDRQPPALGVDHGLSPVRQPPDREAGRAEYRARDRDDIRIIR